MSATGHLTEEQKRQFFDEGWVVVPDLFSLETLEPIRDEIGGIVDRTANELFSGGKIENLREGHSFEERLVALLHDRPETWEQHRKAIEGKAGGGHAGKEMYELLKNERLLNAMESLVGEEIIASSVYRIRPKLPGLDRGEIPWHQDSGYFSAHCDQNLIVTCWIPLVDATIENGCLLVLPKTHQNGVATHHTGGKAGYLVIQDSDLPLPEDRAIYVPVPLGGALLMTNLTPHSSKSNTTNIVRWSVDLRYQGEDVPTNADLEPEDFDPTAADIAVACYAPEGDFYIRSKKHPEKVPDWERFAARRAKYEAARGLPGPNRGWQPSQN